MLWLCLLLLGGVGHRELLTGGLETVQTGIFQQARTDNFCQEVWIREGRSVRFTTRFQGLEGLDLTYRIRLNPQRLKALTPRVAALARALFSPRLGEYLGAYGRYLEHRITYRAEASWADPEAVLTHGEANCVGLTALACALLDVVGVQNRPVSGFYLEAAGKGLLRPEPHRWLELMLPDGRSLFFDPQRPVFSASYLVVKSGVDFRSVRRFMVSSEGQRMVLGDWE